MNGRTLLLGCLALGAGGALALAPATAWAQDADKQAEKFRLTEEMGKLAARNAWAGVESKYEDLLALNVPLDFDTHTLAAQSAKTLGKTLQVYERLVRAREMQEDPAVLAEIEAIDSAYGRVRIVGNERWSLPLARPSMPFAPDERKSVEYAIRVAEEAGAFEGMLPAGTYVLGTDETKEKLEFTVAPGPDWQVVEASRNMTAGTEGLIVYMGPTAIGGYSFVSTPEPSAPVEGPDGVVPSPRSSAGSGLVLEVGYEVGLTRELAFTASFEYRNLIAGYGQFHGYTGWLAALLRPGNFRFGAGPVYGRWGGSGSGVATDGIDLHDRLPEDILFDGQSWAGGVKATAGYGLLDLEPLQGLVELSGVWQTDGHRTFAGLGLRVGIVPMVPRFKD